MAPRMKVCPQCGEEKQLVRDFGYRRSEEVRAEYPKDIYPHMHYFQPWCTPCRRLAGAATKEKKVKLKKHVERIAKNVPMLQKFYAKHTGDTKKRSKNYMLEKLGV